MNADFRDGYGSLPMSNEPGRRASAATCYLDRQTRGRPNLTVQGGAMVRRLLLDGRRVTGVEAAIDGRVMSLRARHTVLCGGALQSPALLMRSGIGPAAPLRDLGIAVAADLPGVGGNLQNHPVLFIGAWLKPQARQPAQLRSPDVRPICSSTFRASPRGTRSASRSPISARCCGSRFRAGACRCYRPIPRRCRWSSSISSMTNATWRA
jgi:5-(hydroxymethyl)furfural/furfural oxidase